MDIRSGPSPKTRALIWDRVQTQRFMKRQATIQVVGVAKKQRRNSAVAIVRQPAWQPRKAVIHPEMKAVDTVGTLAVVTGTASGGHMVLLNGTANGSGPYQRVGRKIVCKKISVMISIHPATPVPTSVPEDIIFILFVAEDGLVLPANGLADLLQDVTNTGAVSNTVYCHNNLGTAARFKMLAKKKVPLRICGTATGALPCNGAAFQAQQDQLQWNWNIKKDIITHYNAGNTGNIGDIEKNAIILCAYTSLGAGLPTTSYDYSTRVRYTDI